MDVLRIKEVLKEKGMSIRDFAKTANLSYTYASEIVRNSKFPRKETLIHIANMLNVDVKELFHSTQLPDGNKKNIYIKNEAGEFEKIGTLKIE